MIMTMLRALGVLGLLLGLVGCGSTPTTIVQQPVTARPQPVPAEARTNGSIFQMAAYHPLFEDRRPRNVGDTLTINIRRSAQWWVCRSRCFRVWV
jgi:flagellar L-ring protein precursor FlgH